MTELFESRIELWDSSSRLAFLPKAKEVHVREVLNGEYYLTFFYPKLQGDSERYDGLIEENEIRFPEDVESGQRFRIKRVEEIRDGLKIYKLVEGHHIAFSLGQYFYDGFIDFAAAKPPEYLLTELGNNTPFTFAIEGNFDPQDVFEWGEQKKQALLLETRALFNGELSYDNLEITLTTRKGMNNGNEVRYRKNMKGIRKTSHSMERITRLYGYGKNGLTIEGYGGHVNKYIDSDTFDPANPFEGKVEFPEIDDQGRLLRAMEKHLAEYELPKVSYELNLLELYKLGEDYAGERFNVGDTLTVFDEVLGYSFDARVYEYERYPFEPKRGRVVLANFREFRSEDYIFQATVASKKAIVYTSKNAVLKGVKYDDSVTFVDGIGVKVQDDMGRTRVRLGQYSAGKYGLELRNKSGDLVIIDEDGIIQTDTIQEADNVDATHPLKLKFYIDDAVIRVDQVKLAFSLEPFRAYSTGAASGGGSSITSASGGGDNLTSASGGGATNYFGTQGGIDFGNLLSGFQSFLDFSGDHTHDGAVLSDGDHVHLLYDFYLTTPSHTHQVVLPDHEHQVVIPNHSHDIVYGIYEGATATGVNISVDGVERDSSEYDSDQSNIDLTQWITTPGWHTIELSAASIGRINASLYIRSFVGV